MTLTLAQEVGTTTGAPLAIAGFVGLAALTWKVIDFLRMLAHLATNRSGVVTQLLAWIGAIAAVFLYGESQFGDTVSFSGISLDRMDSATKLLAGLALGSAASVGVDLKQAFDHSDSASKPSLLNDAPPPPKK